MKIKHYSRRYLPEIRKRLKLIIDISHKNSLDSNYASTYEMLAEDLPDARESNLELAASVRRRIAEQKAKIESHKKWIEKKAPGFFERIYFVQNHIVTWDHDMPAIRYAPERSTPLPRKTHTTLTPEEREQSLSQRRSIMNHWYCFFFGTDHLKNLNWWNE